MIVNEISLGIQNIILETTGQRIINKVHKEISVENKLLIDNKLISPKE